MMRGFADRWANLRPALPAAMVWVMLAHGVAHACAVCGHATTPGDPLGRGFYWGMLFLLAMPFSVVGTMGGWVAYRYWRAGRRRRAADASPWSLRQKVWAIFPGRPWTQKESES
jgi:hypothetical protein